MKKLIVAESAGFCFGVERSVRLAEDALKEGPCFCLGQLMHNDAAVAALEAKGLRVIHSPEELPEGAESYSARTAWAVRHMNGCAPGGRQSWTPPAPESPISTAWSPKPRRRGGCRLS
jgi:hypothetical protein